MSNTNATFLISLVVIIIGYLIKQWKIVKEEDGKVVSKIVLYVTFPALILNTVPYLNITSSLLILPLIPLLYSLFVFLLSYQLFKRKPNAIKGLLLMAVVGFNIGLFAYPIIESIWGAQGLQYIAMFDIGNALIVLGLSYGAGSVFSPKHEGKISMVHTLKLLLRSVPLITYVLALLINVSGFTFPPVLHNFIEVIARANMALVLLLLGIYLNLRFKKELLKSVSYVLLIRYGFGLIVGITLYYMLPFDPVYRAIVLIALILPVGLTIIPFADEFAYDYTFAGAVANLSIIISFMLMWTLITLLNLA